MKILGVTLERFNGRLEPVVRVDAFPPHESRRYEKRGPLYFCHTEDGFVSFFAYEGPSDGFGGAKFPITLTDGTETVLQGPWSSRSGVMNNAGFEPSKEVSFDLGKGGCRFAGSLTVAALERALAEFQPGYELRRVIRFGETYYEVAEQKVWVFVVRGEYPVKETHVCPVLDHDDLPF